MFLTLVVCFLAVELGAGQPIIINRVLATLGGPQEPMAPVVLEFEKPAAPCSPVVVLEFEKPAPSQPPVVLEFEPHGPAPEFGNDLPPIVEVPARETLVPEIFAEPALIVPPRETLERDFFAEPALAVPPPRVPVIREMFASPAARVTPRRPLQAPPGCERPRFLGVIGLDPPDLPDNSVNFLAPTRPLAAPAPAQFNTPRPPSP